MPTLSSVFIALSPICNADKFWSLLQQPSFLIAGLAELVDGAWTMLEVITARSIDA